MTLKIECKLDAFRVLFKFIFYTGHMESIVEYINIQVERLISNDVIVWDDIMKVLERIQSVSPSFSESLINLFNQVKSHYENDLNAAKNIYQQKSMQYELLNAQMQINDLNADPFNHEQPNEEEDEFNFPEDDKIVLEGLKTTEAFNFPMNSKDLVSKIATISQEQNEMTSLETKSMKVPCSQLVDKATQEEKMDCKRINQLIHENNQYLKVAQSWKIQCEAATAKLDEMRRSNNRNGAFK